MVASTMASQLTARNDMKIPQRRSARWGRVSRIPSVEQCPEGSTVGGTLGSVLCVSPRFDFFHVLVGKAEMMAEFVDQHMGDDFAERVVVVLGPIVEDGAAVEEHGVGELPGLGHGAVFGEADAGEKAHQFEWALHIEMSENVVFGKFGDRAGDVGRERLERLGQFGQRLAGQRLEVIEGRGIEPRPIGLPYFHSRISTKWPAMAAAAAMAGETRWVRPLKPWRPSKLRFEVEAQRSSGLSLSGFMARHMEQPGSRHSKPAFLKITSRPSSSACAFTSPEPGTIMAETWLATLRSPITAAAARRSSIRPLVQEPTKTRSSLMSVILVPGLRPI